MARVKQNLQTQNATCS